MSVCDSSTGRTAEILSENKEKDEQAEIKEHDQMVKRMSHTRQTSQKIQYKNTHGNRPCIAFPFP